MATEPVAEPPPTEPTPEEHQTEPPDTTEAPPAESPIITEPTNPAESTAEEPPEEPPPTEPPPEGLQTGPLPEKPPAAEGMGEGEEYTASGNRVPIGKGWFAEYNEDEDLWYIFDENGIPLGTVKLPDGMSIWEFDFDNWLPPLAVIAIAEDVGEPITAPEVTKTSPQTGDGNIHLIWLFMTSLPVISYMIFAKKRRT